MADTALRDGEERCSACGKPTREGTTYGRCPTCWSALQEGLPTVHQRKDKVLPARMGKAKFVGEAYDLALEEDTRPEVVHSKPFEIGYATFLRDKDEATCMIVVQAWIERKPTLIFRFDGSLHFIRFRDTPTTDYHEIIIEVAGDQFQLLSNGPLVRANERTLGPTIKKIAAIAQNHWKALTDQKQWELGSFRKEPVALYVVSEIVGSGKKRELVGRALKYLEVMKDNR